MKMRLKLVELVEFEKAKSENRSTYRLPSITVTRNVSAGATPTEITVAGVRYRVMECYPPHRAK